MAGSQRDAGRIRAGMSHQGARGRVRAAAPAMRVDAEDCGGQPTWLTQVEVVPRPADVMPPEMVRRSSSLSSVDFDGFLAGSGFALLDGFCLLVGIRSSSLGHGYAW
jgi:hypothetical protein